MSKSKDDAPATESLIAEYQANISLWQHDDTLRQQRNATFLTVNTVLLTALAALTALKVPLAYLGAIGFVFSLFGVVVCRVWHLVQLRNSEYVRFRRFQLRSIEARLPGLTTFQNVYQAFYDGKEVTFSPIDASFSVARSARGSSTISEGKLPLVLGLLWSTIALAGIVVLVSQASAGNFTALEVNLVVAQGRDVLV